MIIWGNVLARHLIANVFHVMNEGLFALDLVRGISLFMALTFATPSRFGPAIRCHSGFQIAKFMLTSFARLSCFGR